MRRTLSVKFEIPPHSVPLRRGPSVEGFATSGGMQSIKSLEHEYLEKAENGVHDS